MGRLVIVLLSLAAAGIGGAVLFYRPDQRALLATAAISDTLCEAVFASGLDPDRAFHDQLAPFPATARLGSAVRYDVDRARRQVTTTLAGLFASRSLYREGLGCLLLRGSELPAPIPPLAAAAALLPEIAGPAVVEPGDPRLRAALADAFAEPDAPPYRLTRAVVIVHDGRVVAERYAPGCGPETPLPGFSATKSVIAALVGILVRDGKLAPDAPAPVAAWQAPGDARHAITIDNLLRMTSGLAWEEGFAGGVVDDATRMRYLAPDMAAYAARRSLAAPPGATWQYNSGNTMILSRLVRDAAGGGVEDVERFARRELFEPLGMHHVELPVDAAGTPVGAFGMLASARDWARFGMLYLDDGRVAGRRILPAGWVDRAASPTPGAVVGYGAGFWTNRGDSWGAANRLRWGMPADSFFASGILGQYVVVVPSARLVVVRLGWSLGPYLDTPGVARLVREAIAALTTPAPESP